MSSVQAASELGNPELRGLKTFEVEPFQTLFGLDDCRLNPEFSVYVSRSLQDKAGLKLTSPAQGTLRFSCLQETGRRPWLSATLTQGTKGNVVWTSKWPIYTWRGLKRLDDKALAEQVASQLAHDYLSQPDPDGFQNVNLRH
jgi:hypothetical protein